MTYSRPAPAAPADGAMNYLETRLRTASSVELTVILHDVLLESLRRAADAAEAGCIEERVQALNRVVSALAELRCALDHERGGAIAASLDRLYAYALGQATGSFDAGTAETLRALRRLFSPLREAWTQVAAAAAAAPAPAGVAGEVVPAGVGVRV